ncbi:MAG: hypothetical protein RLZ10_210 [Bacteroidota bacterium]|jgi:hypothetical protein
MEKNKTEALYAPVKKVELSTIFPGKSFPRSNDHAILDQHGNFLSFCSSSYNLRENSTLYKPVEDLMRENKIPFDRKINVIEGTKFYVDYIIRDRVKSLTVNDILPKFSIWNSYDGTLKTTMKYGFYRVVCSNGLTRPHGNTFNISKKHRKAIGVEDGLDLSLVNNHNILDSVKVFLNDVKEDMEVYERMNHVQADVNRILSVADKLKFSKNLLDKAVERFALETSTNSSLTYVNENGELVKHDGSPATLYTVYNALNYAIYNSNPKELPESKLKRDQLVLAEVLA